MESILFSRRFQQWLLWLYWSGNVILKKCENSMLLNNYRPVSVLQVFSKILERPVYNRLLSFINKHNLLYRLHFGFREKHGADTALIILIDKIMSAINEDEIVLGVFLDLNKAFDTTTCGVPQGSIWVHFCFFYMSMIWLMFFQFYLQFYLLMTQIYLFKAKVLAISLMNDELCKLSEWMAINKFSLNVKKTKCMIFSSRKEPISSTCVTHNGEIADK